MNEISKGLVENLLVPFMAAQIFTMVLIYFCIVRKRLSYQYKDYLLFLGAFILFLIGRPIQYYGL